MFKISQKKNIVILSGATTSPNIVVANTYKSQETKENHLLRAEVSETLNPKPLFPVIENGSEKHAMLLFDSRINLKSDNLALFSDVDGEFTLPPNVKKAYLTLCAGGGKGGKPIIKGKLYYSGAGGGGGEGYAKIPLNIENDDFEIKIAYKVGKGGKTLQEPDGGNTVFTIYVNGKYHSSITAKGGKGGKSDIGGEGCSKYLIKDGYGKSGKTIATTSHIPTAHKGGLGGPSPYYHGGKGYDYTMQDRNECNGKWGSGGGGGIDTSFITEYGHGGDGFVLIELEC